MQEYDVALKLLLRGSARLTVSELTGGVVESWIDAELPKVQSRRADLLGENADGALMHLELQSSNDATMPLRMGEYCLGIYRLFGKFPRQVLLYVGDEPLRMESELRGPDVWIRFAVRDIRDLDGERLLESTEVGDNVIAVLARLRSHHDAIRRIMERIAGLAPAEREAALGQLLILSGLRHLEEMVEEEARKMPILNDILEHKVLGREYKRGLQEGELKGEIRGELRGELKGELKGELTILRRQIEKRFGAIPNWAEERLAGRTTAELEDLSVCVLDAQSLEELLK